MGRDQQTKSELDSANASGMQALTLRLVIEPPECCILGVADKL